MFREIILWIFISKAMLVLSNPEGSLAFHEAADRFQNTVQQQTFQSTLISIEKRLRNLDDIYSMQLSETLKSKMDLYHRKLDSLDMKMIQLESVVMLNLDKMSENISTKTYKDDVTRIQMQRKLDNVYDGIARRIDYIDRKFEVAMEKIQNKIDTTLQRLERMEEDMIQRNTDMESELSESLSIVEDYKTSSNRELVLLNITNILKEIVSNGSMIEAINLTMNHLVQDFNESVARHFDSLGNNVIQILNVTEENKKVSNSMKIGVQEDFNAYANKVADMNMNVWKRQDIVDESLKAIETLTNSTRTEVQNGVRALMLQVGKLSGKGIMNNDKTSLESFKKGVNLSLDKIITNQELFLESCHRVQMDESQIETEISVMLGKLIDMLETRMTTVAKDLKNIEKSVKSHDSRIQRNLYQANTNIVSLFEKTTRANEFAEKQLRDVKFNINSLFAFVQDVLSRTNNTEDLLSGISVNISNLIQLINSNNANSSQQSHELEDHFFDTIMLHEKVAEIKQVMNHEFNHQKNSTENIDESLVKMGKLIAEIQRVLQSLNATDVLNNTIIEYENRPARNVSTSNNTLTELNRKNCTQNYRPLIDIRTGSTSCDDATENQTINTTQIISEDETRLNEVILEIFGRPATPSTTANIAIKPKDTKAKNNLSPRWAEFTDLSFGSEDNDTSLSESSTEITSTDGGITETAKDVTTK